jgi:dihydroorotase
MKHLLIRGGRIVDPSQQIDLIGDLLIRNGKVAQLGAGGGAPPAGCPVLEAQGLVVCPGFVDLHCHLRQPGFEEKETIATGTRAAARGGFTTVCCMPNTNPPLDNAGVVEYIQNIAQAEAAIRVLPIGCITKGRRGEELAEMGELAAAGVAGFSDDGNPVTDARLMRYALEYSLAFGLPIISHAEELSLAQGGVMNEGAISTRLGLRGIPSAAEEIMVARDLILAGLTGARLHIAHVSTAGSVELIRRAKERGVSVTAEVTPHHLTLTEERLLSPPYDTNAKVNPPLRTERDTEALLGGLREGVIDAIATDHSPHATQDKMCEFDAAAFGISGFETALGSLMLLFHRGGIDLTTLIARLTMEPAQVLGRGELGTLKVGMAGDVTIFDPEAEWTVNPQHFVSKGKNTPLAGSALKGRVLAAVVGGGVVYKEEQVKVGMKGGVGGEVSG